MESIDARFQAWMRWLHDNQVLQQRPIEPLQHDASFRRYFRVFTAQGSLIAMDAPPPQENCRPFVAIAKALRHAGLEAPAIFAQDLDQGWLLLSDFGDTTYLKALNAQNADALYERALNALICLQACRNVPGRDLPLFTADFMLQEWAWHKEWFLDKWLGLDIAPVENALDACYQEIVVTAVNQPQVFMHRDFHSANLMVLPEKVGILDFQDAFIGPVTYDLVSLLRDCYIAWPEERVRQWVIIYWKLLIDRGVIDVDQETFYRWFDWMGVQRHLKALLTFARKKVRDHQDGYLRHIPRTLQYLLTVTQRYPELTALHDYLHTTVKPAVERELS